MTPNNCNTCKHAASGCNYPEGECVGDCMTPRAITLPAASIEGMDDMAEYAERKRNGN